MEFAAQGEKVREKIISPGEVKVLLQYALDRECKAECASMALVFFCGVRVDEINRLNWSLIRLNGAKSFVDVHEAKNRHRRVNSIPPNAVEWLRLCQSGGRVAPGNYTKRMQRLRKRANVYYPQNAARHCFASYHIAYNHDAAQTAFLLGHPNAALLYNTYRELVTFEEAEKFWNILPDSVIRDQADLERERDEDERAEAEAQSNIGIAVKLEDGRWHPRMDEEVDSASYSDVRDALANL